MIIEALMIASALTGVHSDSGSITVVDSTLPLCHPDNGSKQPACIDILPDGTRVVRINYGKISMEA